MTTEDIHDQMATNCDARLRYQYRIMELKSEILAKQRALKYVTEMAANLEKEFTELANQLRALEA